MSVDVERLLDPEVREALALLPPMGPINGWTLPKVREGRAALLAAVVLSDQVERRVERVPGWEGDPEVELRIHRPKGASGDLPCIYWVHGGGYVLGSAEMDDARFDRWCVELNCVGVAVDYRLAPETPYPGPLHDCYAGLQWVHAHVGELGVDRGRLGIGGASAGGGLGAALGLFTRDRGEIPLSFQLLVYPMIDDRLVTPSSQWAVPIWEPSSNAFGWGSYLGPLAGSEIPAYAAPSRAVDLAGLPPTYIMVGTLDGFLDEDIDYAQRLNQAGVPTELHVYPGAPHGFELFAPSATVARRARADILDWLRRVL